LQVLFDLQQGGIRSVDAERPQAFAQQIGGVRTARDQVAQLAAGEAELARHPADLVLRAARKFSGGRTTLAPTGPEVAEDPGGAVLE